jgi:pentapeptide MXKDX repeat protein
MTIQKNTLLALSAAALSGSLCFVGVARADDMQKPADAMTKSDSAMGKPHSAMSNNAMSKDTMKKKSDSAMSNDKMGKGDAMSSGAMKPK